MMRNGVSLHLLGKRYLLTGTAAPADRPVTALLPAEWHEMVRQECAARNVPVARYLRGLVGAHLRNAGKLPVAMLEVR